MSYKVVEVNPVTEEEIERVLNEWIGKGYVFESLHFVNSDASKRPRMAFIFFQRKENE